jgi:hypothetical protein
MLETLFSVLTALFVISFVGNVIAIILWNRKPKKANDRTANDLLHDLTAYGNALVRIERIAPTDVLLRSPRQ